MSEVGKVLFGQRSAREVEEVIEKAKELAAVINAAELDDLRNKVAHVWQNSVMGLLALRLTSEHHEAAGTALKRLTNS